jgi:hypothetical protein
LRRIRTGHAAGPRTSGGSAIVSLSRRQARKLPDDNLTILRPFGGVVKLGHVRVSTVQASHLPGPWTVVAPAPRSRAARAARALSRRRHVPRSPVRVHRQHQSCASGSRSEYQWFSDGRRYRGLGVIPPPGRSDTSAPAGQGPETRRAAESRSWRLWSCPTSRPNGGSAPARRLGCRCCWDSKERGRGPLFAFSVQRQRLCWDMEGICRNSLAW